MALDASDVTGGEGGEGGGTMRMTRWVLVGLIGLLVAGCASPTPTIAPTHTSVPTVTPILGQAQSTAPPPTPTAVPTATPPVPTATPMEAGGVTITILYDNNEYDERLETAWGFSCLVELPPASGGAGGGGWLDTPIYDGSKLQAGNRIKGPAIIEEVTTTIIVCPNDLAKVDRLGNVVIEVNGKNEQ
ncbi:MAG: hypothetical protein KAX26_04445 [Anaerolineae bacterium]|nr:hypothetical protein [Anaerolineae bacterium]